MTESNDGRAGSARVRRSVGKSRRSTVRESGRAASIRHSRRKVRSKPVVVTVSVIGGLVVVLAAAGGWLGFRALNAKSSLETAQTLVGTLKTQAGSMDFAGIGKTSIKLSTATRDAVDQTHDPVWRVAEFIPFAGSNLRVVRQLAEAVDSVAQNGVAPLASVASTFTVDSLKPVEGKLNLEPIKQLAAAMAPAATAIDAAAKSVSAIDLGGTIGPVSDAGVTLKTMMASANSMVGGANSALQLAPDMLGASGPRTYILIFQNLAEATALGGTSAALSEITVNDGAINVTRQASSADFPYQDGTPIIEADPNLQSLYTPEFYTRLNLATSRPDFPTAAKIAQGFWQQDIGGTVDGVISVDPVALSHLLKVTGPVTMSTGDQLTSENVVALLLNGIYLRYPNASLNETNQLTDPFFAEAAASMFGALMHTTADPKVLLNAVAMGVNEHRIMAWSAHPEEQNLIAGTAVDGVLPTTNDETTTTGVFFRDMSASKMDYYLKTAVRLTTDVCTTSTPTFTTTIDLHSDITVAEAKKLPAYVASGTWGAKQFQTQVFVYGPPGSTLAGSTVDVAGVQTTVGGTTDDLGRPVVWFWVILAPGEKSTVTATFTGAAGNYAEPEVRTTPMLNPTASVVDATGCSSDK